MFFVKLRRVIRGGFASFWRNGAVSLASVLVLVVTLFVIGSLILSQAVLDSSLASFKDKVDINVYFKNDAPEEAPLAVQKFLKTLPEVKEVTYTSKEEALARFRSQHEDNSLIISALEEIGGNPLGASLNIRAKDPSQYESIAKVLESDAALGTEVDSKNFEYIDKVNYFQNKVVIDKLTSIIGSTEKLGLAIAVILSLLAVAVTFNTIRLAIYTAREEIAVMKLVGASNNYVRGPFVIEGIICGVLAAALVMSMLYALSASLGDTTQNFFGALNLYNYFTDNFLELFALLVVTGSFLGAVSSYLAVWRYLKV